MSGAAIKGWCPTAYRPMMSGDGLLVRVRPRLGRLTAAQARRVAGIAIGYGNGSIDLTSRANLQIRGVGEANHGAVLDALVTEGLVDPDPAVEARRAIVATPDWQPGDLTDRLGKTLEDALLHLPDLPDKMGIVLDTGPSPVLQGVSGDFRFETDSSSGLMLRADGSEAGCSVDETTAIPALLALANWFVTSGGAASKRMAPHVAKNPLPDKWQTQPRQTKSKPATSESDIGQVIGVPFGAMTGTDVLTLIKATGPAHIRVTPRKTLILEGAKPAEIPAPFTTPDRHRMNIAACPGAPACAAASVATRDLAMKLAKRVPDALHVSGCAKGCAHPKAADVTLVGRDGRFDLVRHGRAGDTPVKTGLAEADLLELFT